MRSPLILEIKGKLIEVDPSKVLLFKNGDLYDYWQQEEYPRLLPDGTFSGSTEFTWMVSLGGTWIRPSRFDKTSVRLRKAALKVAEARAAVRGSGYYHFCVEADGSLELHLRRFEGPDRFLSGPGGFPWKPEYLTADKLLYRDSCDIRVLSEDAKWRKMKQLTRLNRLLNALDVSHANFGDHISLESYLAY
jgi:hypothetical protein